ncbi:hypothetical protein FRC11_004492, partial [Ceratobasidium sp. 423]
MLEEGVYQITSYTGGVVVIPEGAHPGVPVGCMQELPPSAIHIRPLGEVYSLTPGNFAGPGHLAIGFLTEGPPMVVVVPAGIERTEWYIDYKDQDKYEIRAAEGPGDQYWTVPRGGGGP